MDAEDAVRRAAAVLAVEPDEAYRILSGALASGSPEETLCDLLGYENIELVAAAVQHRAYFCDAEVTNEEPKYVEHVIPPGKSIRVPEDELVSTSAAGADARHFGYERFNAVQSRVFPAAYQSGGNMLVCAPTGAGKTDVALLAILRELKEPRSQVVYIAPMKALATEVVAKYRRVFSGSDVPVIEYTGDTEIDAGTANKARVIVCTPEKFDVSTRRLAPLFKSIRLVVIDEIHLLGDSRGPVLEVLVARMFRMSELHQRFIRIVGLSATLPNYKDVARFIRAEHVFFFDAMYRPVPLGVTITGFKKGSKQADEQAYLLDKLGALLRNKHQALVFVNSRAQTVAVAKLVMGLTAPVPVPAPSDSEGTGKQRRGRRAQTRLTGVHEHLFLNRVGVHHAGMPRGERLAMEEYFREGKIDVLVSTSTLAWGVNLPARAVFIYGTSFYNAARGAFDDLGILDVVQIFGRAGRPQYDTAGEAVLITRASKLDMYIAMLKASKTVESSMLHHITDAMCAEVCLSTIKTVATALRWVKHTFLYVRMRQNPALYGLVVESGTEPAARRLGRLQIGGGAPTRASAPLPAGSSLDENALSDYILLSIKRLEACGLLKISRVDEDNHNTWHFAATAFGRIASLYYISHLTVHQWLCGLGKTAPSETALLMLLLDSQELKAVTLRSEETACLNDMHSRLLLACAIDTEFEASDACKHLVLIVAHFNYMRPSVFSLACDLDYMVDALERLIAALKQILLHLRLYAFYRAALALETRIKRLRLEEAPFYECSATNCGGFVHLSLDVSEKAVAQYKGSARGCALLLYSGTALVYAAEFSKHFSGYIECPAKGLAIEVQGLGMHRREQLAVKTDYSLGALYRTGIHVCDPTYRLAGAMRGCIHLRPADEKAQGRPAKLTGASSSETFANILDIRLELDIQFIKVEAVGYAERLKLIDTQIHGLAGSVLVVCPGPPVDTANSLNTLNLLGESFDLLYECKQSAKGRGGHPRWVAGLGEAAGIAHKFSTVVFKGCRDARDFYPLYEVMRVCSGRRALVYEGEDFIEYFRMILGKRIAHHGSVNGNEN